MPGQEEKLQRHLLQLTIHLFVLVDESTGVADKHADCLFHSFHYI